MSYNNGSSSKSYALVVNQDGCVGLKTTTDQSITDSPLLPIVGHSANYVLPGDEKQHLDDIDDIIQMLRFGLGADGTEQRCDATIGYLDHYLPAVNGGIPWLTY